MKIYQYKMENSKVVVNEFECKLENGRYKVAHRDALRQLDVLNVSKTMWSLNGNNESHFKKLYIIDMWRRIESYEEKLNQLRQELEGLEI